MHVFYVDEAGCTGTLADKAQRCGFTLIELLVVIGIIGILAALLLPVLASARRRAQEINCLSNVKQLTLASYAYATDYGAHAAYSVASNAHELWMGMGYYGNQRKLLVCPSTHEPSPVPQESTGGAADLTWVWDYAGTVGGTAGTNVYLGSYAVNGWLYDRPEFGAGANIQFMMSKQSVIQKPSQTPVFCDSMWVDLWPYESDPPCTDLYRGTRAETGMERCTISRHGGVNAAQAPRDFDISQRLPGAIVIGFADGHAGLVRLENLWGLYWHRDWQAPAQRPR
ncbi:MAG: type II secretion system GspH family protein [Verrucomicrobia bacterium]|nr:type II secretion system GspH family protein [Verrucomicrobiota bacterium]MDE3098214.1 type II secretion system protein [Verrucomicrobiota bacterium]